MFYVYCHKIPNTNEIFYIGKGTKNRAWSKRPRNRFWTNIVNKYGYNVEILMDNLSETSAFIQEYFFIKHYKPRANICMGGVGGDSETTKIHWKNKEYRDMMTLNTTNMWKDPLRKQEISQKISKSLTGKPLKQEHKEKAIFNLLKYDHLKYTEAAMAKKSLALSKAIKGRKLTPEWIEKIASQKRGTKRSLESKLQQAITSGFKPFLVYNRNNELLGEWINKEECARDLNLSGSNINRCLRKKT